MIKKNEKESIGSLKISQDVITSIANMAAREVEGVASIVDSSKIKDMFNIKKGLTPKSMRVDVNNDLAMIDVCIKVKNGCKIQIVSQNVQQKVKDAIQSMTGIAISKVNVHIIGIDFETDSDKNSDKKIDTKFKSEENSDISDIVNSKSDSSDEFDEVLEV